MKTEYRIGGGSKEAGDMAERRKKTPFDYLAPGSGMVSTGLLLFVLQQVSAMQDTIDDYRDLIMSNTITNQRVEKTLSSMNAKFNLDIQRFELEHARLKQDMKSLMLKQEGSVERMRGMEGALNKQSWWTGTEDRQAMEAYDVAIKRWAEGRFEPKKRGAN